VLVLDNGNEIQVTGYGILGRDPQPRDGATPRHVIALDDPDKSVSKTHLEFGVDSGRLWIADLYSTNGTRVFTRFGGVNELSPGGRTTVEGGETVQFGDRYFAVKEI
jgi:pSer/pThr/pTyr-binding forkhead associated (FHA) protein